LIDGVVAADLMLYAGFGSVAVGSMPKERNSERHPSDRLVVVADACTGEVDAGGAAAVDLPGFVTAIESAGHDFDMR